MQWYEMQCMSSLPIINPTKGSEGCNHIAQFNMRCCTDTYRTNTTVSSYAYQRRVQKMQHFNAWTSYTSNFNIKINTTINDKVYSKTSKINFIYQVIWLIWILKLNGGDSNNEWKLVDHDAIFTCLLQLSIHKAKHDPKEHHLITSKTSSRVTIHMK
jgi:hypothetical protein